MVTLTKVTATVHSFHRYVIMFLLSRFYCYISRQKCEWHYRSAENNEQKHQQ